jgi:CheY-like chemotaxis protein
VNLAGRTILLVDDEAYVTQAIGFNLQKAGAAILIRRNGAEMCEAAAAHQPDLIITDYQMPVLDGFAASLQLNENPRTKGIPVILLTARAHRLEAAEIARANIHSLFDKPFSVKELMARIESILTGPSGVRFKIA